MASFLRQHIASGREHKHARTAAFISSGGPSPVCAACDQLLAQPEQFVSASREISLGEDSRRQFTRDVTHVALEPRNMKVQYLIFMVS